MACFWLAWLLILYGCTALRYRLGGWTWLPESFRTELTTFPVIGSISINVIIALVVVPGATAIVFLKVLHKPKVADFLIETEQELRKVAWPSFVDTRSAAIIVIITVLVLAGYLAGADMLLSSFFERLF